MSWLALAPTWKLAVPMVPSSSAWPLNEVVVAMRFSSEPSWPTSVCSAWRSLAELVAFDDCTASSRIRCRMSPELDSAPSAVCASETPSLALRVAWLMPRICDVIRSEIARPAASSLALLMRRPEDRRCSEVLRLACEVDRLRCEFSDAIFVLMTCAMVFLQNWYYVLWARCLSSLWCVSLFRDNHTAVIAGNGFPYGKFRQKRRENFRVQG